MKTSGERLLALRSSKKWSQGELAKQATNMLQKLSLTSGGNNSIGQSTISDLENNRKSTSAEYLEAIASVLNTSARYILLGDEVTPKGIQSYERNEDLNLEKYVVVERLDIQFAAGVGFESENEPEVHDVGSAFRKDWIRAKGLKERFLKVVEVDGDSYLPYVLPGSSVLIDTRYNLLATIVPNKVYCILYAGQRKFKKLSFNIDGDLNLINGSDVIEEVVAKQYFEGQIKVIGRYVAHSSDQDL